MSKSKVTKHVVAAIIKDKDQFFAAQRKEKDVRYLQYEFPGGKIRAHETKEVALKREIKEELEMEITELTEFMHVTHDYGTFILEMTVFVARVRSRAFKLNVHAGASFFTKEQLEKLPFLGADEIVLQKFLQSDYVK